MFISWIHTKNWVLSLILKSHIQRAIMNNIFSSFFLFYSYSMSWVYGKHGYVCSVYIHIEYMPKIYNWMYDIYSTRWLLFRTSWPNSYTLFISFHHDKNEIISSMLACEANEKKNNIFFPFRIEISGKTSIFNIILSICQFAFWFFVCLFSFANA